jgi:hypothetical protein
VRTALALVVCGLLMGTTSARAERAATDSLRDEACEGLPVRHVDVRCRNIFEPVPLGRFSGFYRLANRLHIRTRSVTVRDQLLFAPGQPWRAERVKETERLLRDLEYLEPERIQSRVVGDSVDVEVVTRDQWTTNPELNLERGGGRTFGSIGLTERNLLGLGVGLAFSLRSEPAGHSHALDVGARRIFHTPLEAQFHASTGSAGVTNGVPAPRAVPLAR